MFLVQQILPVTPAPKTPQHHPQIKNLPVSHLVPTARLLLPRPCSETPPKHRHNSNNSIALRLTVSLGSLLERCFLHSKQLLSRQPTLLQLIRLLLASLLMISFCTITGSSEAVAHLQLLLMLISHIQYIRDILPKAQLLQRLRDMLTCNRLLCLLLGYLVRFG